MHPALKLKFKNKKDKVGVLADSPDTTTFYESLNKLLEKNKIQHLNLEWMKLGDKVILITEALTTNLSLLSLHISYNNISE